LNEGKKNHVDLMLSVSTGTFYHAQGKGTHTHIRIR